MQKYQDVVLNQNGNPVAGVQVTVTDLLGNPVSVYSTNMVGLNVNPLSSDTNGRFSFYAPDGRYSLTFTFGGNVVASVTDILLEDPMNGSDAVFNNVTVLGKLSDASKITSAAIGGISATNVQDALTELDSEKASAADLAAPGGSALVGFKQSGTGAVSRTAQAKMRDVVSVRDFGVSGDGSDETTKLQAALNSGANTVLLPAGNYVFTTLTVPHRVTIEGEGPDTTFLSTTTSANALSIGERNTLKGFTLRQTSGTKQGKGIFGSDKYWLVTECFKVLGFDYGLYCDKAIYHSHKQSWFEECNYGCYYWGASGAWNTDWFNNVITFDTCRFNANTNIGTYLKATEVVLVNPDWSGMIATNAIGLRVVGEDAGQPAHGIKVIAPYAEATDIIFSFLYANVEIDGGFVQGGGAAGASAATSIVDASNSHVWWNGRMRDQDYWDYGYRLSNNSRLTFDYGFSGSVMAGNTVDETSRVGTKDYEEGSFTATLTGCTTSPTVTAYYVRNGRSVVISVPAVTATSNSTACGFSGLPASLYPTREQIVFGVFINDGGEASGPVQIQINGTVRYYPTLFGNSFQATGLKGNRNLTLSYQTY